MREIISQTMATWKNECYVNDEDFATLEIEARSMLMEFLERQDIQVIFTHTQEPDLDVEHNQIKLGTPERK